MLNFPDTPTIGQQFPSPTGTFSWDGVKWVPVGPPGGMGDAPTDGKAYGRQTNAWAPVLPLTGGTITPLASADANITLNKPAGTQQNLLTGQAAGIKRWQAILGNGAAESGSNAGSNFEVARFSDAGAYIDSPLTINRASGFITFTAGLQSTGGAVTAPSYYINGPVQWRNILAATNGVNRWSLNVANGDAETGSNAGSNFQIYALSDTGGGLSTPLQINRASGVVSLGGFTNGAADNPNACVNIRDAAGIWGIYFKGTSAGANNYAETYIAPNGTQVGWIIHNDTSTSFANASDARMKENDAPFAGGRAIIDRIAIKTFDWKVNGESAIGVIAQDAYAAYPAAITPGKEESDEGGFMPWGVDYSKYVPLLIQTLQDAFKQIDELRTRVVQLELKT